MRKLEPHFTKNEISFTEVFHNMECVIYICKNKYGASWYEIFRYKVLPPTVILGRNVPEREAYPTNDAFGRWAWTTPNKKGLKRIMSERFGYDDSFIDDVLELI